MLNLCRVAVLNLRQAAGAAAKRCVFHRHRSNAVELSFGLAHCADSTRGATIATAKAGTMSHMLIRWHLVGRAAHREDMLGPLDIDTFKVGAAYTLPVEGDLLVLPLDDKPEPAQLRVKRRRFDFSGAEPELHIDLELVRN